jgi:hypothetical protein
MLPTKKTEIKSDATTSTIAIVGNPKVGKTTFASQLDENVIFAATESGHDYLSLYKVDIKTFEDFEKMIASLATDKHQFKSVAIDTIDNLIEMAERQICEKNKVQFIKDIPFGAGYTATKKLVTTSLVKIQSLGLGVIIITHAKEKEYKQENISYTAMGTSISKSYESAILGFCDFILYCYIDNQNKRMVRTKPSKYVLCAGDRSTKLPEKIEMDAKQILQIIKNPIIIK